MGQWNNQDQLVLQFGTAKANPDWSGEYNIGGSTREVECLIPLVPITMGGYTMPAIPQSSWASATSYAAAGISNPDLLIPLQVTAVSSSVTSSITISKPQLYFESLSLTLLDGSSAALMTGASSLNIGLVTYSPASSAFIWVTPNGTSALLTALASSVTFGLGDTITYMGPNQVLCSAVTSGSQNISTSTVGKWIGQVPAVTTTTTTPVWSPNSAWIGAYCLGGTGTSIPGGLLKMRLKYSWNGSINQ